MAKKLKFGKIRIYFRDGKTDVIQKRLWDDYTYDGALFVVKNHGAWIATYNIADVSRVISE